MKLCPRCEVLQPEAAFHWKRKADGVRHSHCSACVNVKNRLAWSDQDRHGKKRRQVSKIAQNTAIIHAAKNRPCMDCGIQYPPYVMDLDHRDPGQKLFTVAQIRAGSSEKLLAEIAKCDVVCANCHRIRTFGPKVSLEEGIRRALDAQR